MQLEHSLSAPTSFVSLPDDVICELYSTLADVDPPQCAGRWSFYVDDKQPPSLGWIKLAHVSRRLRNIGLGLPTLWARAVCIFPAGCHDILARAKDAPLTLDLKAGGLIDYLQILPAHELVPRANHIRDVVFSHPGSRAWWKDRILPRLESLHLKYRDVHESLFDGSNDRVDLGVINAPNIRSYEVCGGFIAFNAPALRTLTVGHPVARPLLLDCLRSCPLLSHLSVSDVRNGLAAKTFDTNSISLPHLAFLSVGAPSDMGVVGLLDALDIPTSAEVRFGNCSTPDIFHALLKRRQALDSVSPLGDILNISAVQVHTGEVWARYDRALHLSISEYAEKPFQHYSGPAESGLTYVKKYSAYSRQNDVESPLARALVDAFSVDESPAATVRMLAFHSTLEPRDPYPIFIDPLPESGAVLAQLRDPFLKFTNVTTIYTSGPSAHLYLLLRNMAQPALFPSLNTIIIDACISKVDQTAWDGLAGALASLQGDGRPIDRLVLMGSYFCHISPTFDLRAILRAAQRDGGGGGVVTEVEVDIERIRQYVGEIVDLRGKGCICRNAS